MGIWSSSVWGTVQLLVFPPKITRELSFRCSPVGCMGPIKGTLVSCHPPENCSLLGLLFWCIFPGFRTCRNRAANTGHLRDSAGPLLGLGRCHSQGFPGNSQRPSSQGVLDSVQLTTLTKHSTTSIPCQLEAHTQTPFKP